MINVHIYNVPSDLSISAMSCASIFSNDYPNRVGIRQGVVYGYGEFTLYAYRTKSGRVVVRSI